jgi:hypothetical protein
LLQEDMTEHTEVLKVAACFCCCWCLADLLQTTDQLLQLSSSNGQPAVLHDDQQWQQQQPPMQPMQQVTQHQALLSSDRLLQDLQALHNSSSSSRIPRSTSSSSPGGNQQHLLQAATSQATGPVDSPFGDTSRQGDEFAAAAQPSKRSSRQRSMKQGLHQHSSRRGKGQQHEHVVQEDDRSQSYTAEEEDWMVDDDW